ncbi:MAG: alcohol dehydrogenase catalytic domain-containing protein, partial [Serratia marcescens]|nr:alcohol dehydrogenase catalytic domain-containing protein [Serratia marcescens]
MNITHAYAAHDAKSALVPFDYPPRALRDHDVQIQVLFCGVCHSDLHQARNEWSNTIYPVVPGHEIVGRVSAVGDHVSRYRVGDLVGVGCMVDSCRSCPSCDEGLEQYCENGFTGTYNGQDRQTGAVTYGGYSTDLVVDQDFVLRVPENLDPAGVGIAPEVEAAVRKAAAILHRAGYEVSWRDPPDVAAAAKAWNDFAQGEARLTLSAQIEQHGDALARRAFALMMARTPELDVPSLMQLSAARA